MEDEMEYARRTTAPPLLPPTKQQLAEYWTRFRKEAERDPMFAAPPDWEEIQDDDYSPAMCLDPAPNKSIRKRRVWHGLVVAAGIAMLYLVAEWLWMVL